MRISIRHAIRPDKEFLVTVRKRKLRWYGHITRSTRLAKIILQGTVQGGRRKGKEEKRCEENIMEQTRLKLGEVGRSPSKG